MPKLNRDRVRHRIAELDMSVEQLAAAIDVPYGTLRNAVAGCDPINLQRVYRLLRALNPATAATRISIEELLDGSERVPTEPPKQPKGPKGPPRREDQEPTKGPKRVTAA